MEWAACKRPNSKEKSQPVQEIGWEINFPVAEIMRFGGDGHVKCQGQFADQITFVIQTKEFTGNMKSFLLEGSAR